MVKVPGETRWSPEGRPIDAVTVIGDHGLDLGDLGWTITPSVQ